MADLVLNDVTGISGDGSIVCGYGHDTKGDYFAWVARLPAMPHELFDWTKVPRKPPNRVVNLGAAARASLREQSRPDQRRASQQGPPAQDPEEGVNVGIGADVAAVAVEVGGVAQRAAVARKTGKKGDDVLVRAGIAIVVEVGRPAWWVEVCKPRLLSAARCGCHCRQRSGR